MDNSTQAREAFPEEIGLKQLLEDLTGQEVPFKSEVYEETLHLFKGRQSGLGYSQFNELLLSLGYDRVTHSFFQYLANGTTEFKLGTSIPTPCDLATGVERFRKIAVLLFGNVKYAFKRLSRDPQDLEYWLAALEPIAPSEFSQRHSPIHPIQEIPGKDTYYLGYLVQRHIEDRLIQNPKDQQAIAQKAKQEETIQIGKRNYEAYLASDHLDVYAATSMRERHEYYLVNEWIKEIFSHDRLAPLKLRWFDPTQAYCTNRIDKGLFEALMLKRAKCTVYFAQETDTLGKDSELASTLAQGKAVIAFVPSIDKGYAENLLRKLIELYPDKKDEREVLLNQLRIFEPRAAWEDTEVREWLINPNSFGKEGVIARLQRSMQRHYDHRASTLSQAHPLGIQVNLETGVANGVLVVRNIGDCAELIRRVVTRTMEFSLDEQVDNGGKYVYLRETISGCVYRVVTGDSMLTNTFWNFYLNP